MKTKKQILISSALFAPTFLISSKFLAAKFSLRLATVSLMSSTLIAHELGHFSVAKKYRPKTRVPLVAQVGPIGVGATKVHDFNGLSKSRKKRVLVSGALAGIACALSAGVGLLLIGKSSIIVLSAIGFSEIYSTTLGSDGKKLRRV